MGRLDGSTAIVTGSSRGIGKGIAERFAQEGANVVVNSRSNERARDTATDIDTGDGTVLPIGTDTSDPDAVSRLVEECVQEFGRLDVMVNNAGVFSATPAAELSVEEWNDVLATNLGGVFYGSQAAAEPMIEQGGGQIVNVSSIFGAVGVQGRAAYNASKAGVDNLTRSLAVEWADHGIHVNALAPGFIRTDLDEEDDTREAETSPGQDQGTTRDEDASWPTYSFDDSHIENRTPLGRFGTVEEIANCALFLAEGNHYMTGEVLAADGGWLAFGWGSKGR